MANHHDRGWSPPSPLLWAAAAVLTLAAASWQRLSGPTRPLTGETTVAGTSLSWRLLRAGVSGQPLRVEVDAPQAVLIGTLRWRRYPADERFSGTSMIRDSEGGPLVGLIPPQPPAGKVEYYVVLATRSGLVRIPEDAPVVMRFEGEVPVAVLAPHVVLMLLAMLLSLRTGLGAVFSRPDTLRLAVATLAALTVGGMILGPVVRKFAFDAFWTGWPFGEDVTDSKTLVAWLVWLVAVVALRGARGATDRFARTTAVVAGIVTLAVFLVPHSLGGSELDYARLDAGASPTDAVRTGR